MSKEVKQLTWLHFKLCLPCTRFFFFSKARTSRASQKVAEDLATACIKGIKSEVRTAHAEMVETIQSSDEPDEGI